MPFNTTACSGLSCRWNLESVFAVTSLRSDFCILLSVNEPFWIDVLLAVTGWRLLTCSSLQQIVCVLLFFLIQASKTLITFSDECFALHFVTLTFCSLDVKPFIWFKDFWLYEMRPCTSVKFVRNRGTHREWLHQLLQAQTHRRCPKPHRALQEVEAGRGTVTVSDSTCWGGISVSQGKTDPCLPSGFQCQNWHVLHGTARGTAPWGCALDLAIFLLNILLSRLYSPHPAILCRCLSSSAQILPFPCAPFPRLLWTVPVHS